MREKSCLCVDFIQTDSAFIVVPLSLDPWGNPGRRAGAFEEGVYRYLICGLVDTAGPCCSPPPPLSLSSHIAFYESQHPPSMLL